MPGTRYPQLMEDFCQNIVRGMKPSQAALAAGYAAGYARSDGPAKLLRRAEVIDRIDQLRAHSAKALAYDVARIIAELEDVQQRALAAGRLDAEIKAIIAKAEMLGLKKDKAEIDVNVIYKPVAEPTKKLDLSVEEWQEMWSPREITNGHG